MLPWAERPRTLMAKKKKPTDPRWTSDLRPAPGELQIVQALLNTADFTRQPDVASPQAVAHCLGIWRLVPPTTHLTDGELERAIEVRDALRSLLVANQWNKATDAAAKRLDRAVADAMIRPRFAADGRLHLEPVPDDLDGALARICGIVAVAQLGGTWERMKICPGKKCRAAFYDFSRNQSAKWCSPRCGSRRSSLAYRQRNLESIRRRDRGSAIFRRMSDRIGGG